MRNSTFTPRNRFAQKAMSITTKVMIFGVLLSLFLFACVGIDTLAEIAQAATYSDFNGGVRYRYGNAGKLSTDFSFFNFDKSTATITEQIVSGAGVSESSSSLSGRTSFVHNANGESFYVGWYMSFKGSAFWALKNGQLTVSTTVEMKEHATQNEIQISFWDGAGGSKGSQIGSTTTSGTQWYGDNAKATQDVTSMSKPDSGIATFYTQMYLKAASNKKIQVEPVGEGVKIVATRSETTVPSLDLDKMDDSGYEGTIILRDAGAGIRSVKIIGPGGTTDQTFNAPASPNNMAINAATVTGENNPSPNEAIILNPYFSDSTKYFIFTPTVAGEYDFVVTDHLGNVANINDVEVKKADLVLKDSLSGYEVTLPGVIDRALTTDNPIVVPTSTTSTTTVKRNGSTYSVSSGTSIINGLGYGTGNFKSWSVVDTYAESKRAGITKNTAEETTIVPKMIHKVTLEISWQGYEFGKDENNTGVWGSEGNPYLIQTDQHLKNFARIVSGDLSPLMSVVGKGLNPTSTQAQATAITYAEAHFRLDNSLSSTTPIGKDGKPFAGTFKGNGNTINLSISGTNNNVGLFGYIGASGTVENVKVTGSVAGGQYVGAIAGTNVGTIVGCQSSAKISSTTDYVGGIVGLNRGTIDTCETESGVTLSSAGASAHIGGIAGSNSARTDLTKTGDQTIGPVATIINCANNATITGRYRVGGITGHNEGGVVDSCHNYGSVTTTTNSAAVGGIVGWNYHIKIDEDGRYHCGIIVDCTNHASVTATGPSNVRVGGIAGSSEGDVLGESETDHVKIVNCTNEGAISGTCTSTSTSGFAYTGGISGMNTGHGTIEGCTNTGAVTGSNAYSGTGGIAGYSNNIVTNSNNEGTIIGNYRVGGVVGFNEGGTIGGDSASDKCTNTGDVHSATVSNGNLTYTNYAGGIVGYSSGSGKVKYCENGATITAKYAGGVAGANNGLIEQCTNTAVAIINSKFDDGKAGGIVAVSQTGTVKACTNYGSVTTANQYAGGIVGESGKDSSNAGTIENCINYGNVEGKSDIGGIVGHNIGSVTGCKNLISPSNTTARIYASAYTAGGIVGWSEYGTISHCYNEMDIVCDNTSNGEGNVGGIAGSIHTNNSITNCVNVGTTSCAGTNPFVGGILGNNYQNQSVSNCFYIVPSGCTDVLVANKTKVTNSWVFTTNMSCQVETNAKYVVVSPEVLDGNTLLQVIVPMNGSTTHSWEDIVSTSTSFDGFAFVGRDVNDEFVGIVAPNGKYLVLEEGTGQNATFATPNELINDYNTADGSVLFTSIKYTNFKYNSSSDLSYLVVYCSEIKDTNSGNIDTTYDGTDKANISFFNVDAGDVKVFDENGNEVVNPDTINVTGNTYTISAQVKIGGKVYGQRSYTIKVQAFDLSSDETRVYYEKATDSEVVSGAKLVKLDINNTPSNSSDDVSVYDITNGAMFSNESFSGTFYVYREALVTTATENGQTITTLVRRLLFTYSGGDFVYKNNSERAIAIKGTATFVSNGTPVNESFAKGMSFSGSGNYAKSCLLDYVVFSSDFGKNAGATGAWGSSTNPYVISHWSHLVRLSEIVNKVNQPIDSVKNRGIEPANVQATSIFFNGCYFEVQGTINVPEGIAFLPIGGHDISKNTEATAFQEIYSYFAGNIYGSNGDAAAEINLGNSLSEYDQDYSGLFGLVIGTEAMPATITNLHVSANTISGNRYVGSLVGRAEEYVIIDNSNSTNTYNINIDVTGTEYVGGLVGYVGLGTEIYGRYVNNGNVTASGDYIGGFIGQIIAGAGKEDKTLLTPTFYFGNSDDKILGFENNGIVSLIDGSTASYVGGIIGGTVANTGTYKDYLTILTPEYMRNMAPIAGTNYVGGFIGELSDNVALKLSNYNEYNSNGTVKAEDNWSYNGKKDSVVADGISGTGNYVGGLIGKLDEESHQIIGLFNTMEVYSQGGNFVGGLVGEMVNGTIDYCFVTIPGTTMITADINLVHSTNPINGEMGTSVGGLVGNASGGSIRNSYVQGFSFDVVDSSRGGVAGTANTNVNIENAWALYITNIKDQTIKVESDGTKTVVDEGVTYSTTAKNSNGRYILTYGGRTGDGVNTHAHATATISEMLVFAGLYNDSQLTEGYRKASYAATSDKGVVDVLAMKGMISLGLNLPAATPDSGDAKERIQLTFYDASGYENPFLNPFDGASNDEAMSNLYIRLNANADSSLIIAATAVHFGTVENYNGSEAWQDAYRNIGDDALYQLVMYNGYPYEYVTNADGTKVRKEQDGKYVLDTSITLPNIIVGQEYKPEFQAQYGYDYYSDEATNDPDYKVKYVYTSVKVTRTFGQKSEVAPLIIANETDWINFANSIKSATPTTYLNEHVKLANDITVSSTSYMAGVHGDDNKTFKGTFDGDGHTITINFNANYSQGVSLFPYACDATFKNLKIDGTISSAGLNTAGFVGLARGSLTFENCTNSVDIEGQAYSVGGFIGSTRFGYGGTKYSYKFTGCVNEGNIRVYKQVGQVTFNTYDNVHGLLLNPMLRAPEFNGVGGFIGTVYNGTIKVTYNDVINNDSINKSANAGISITKNENGGEPVYGYASDEVIYPIKNSTENGIQAYPPFTTKPVVTMESCRNAGSILGSYNVGGLIGLNGGSTEIMNCGNTGAIEAIGEGTPTNKLSRWSRTYQITDDESSSPQATRRYIKERAYVRRYLNAGGLVGLSTSQGHVDMYTSYNAGNVHAWGNNAGGLIASDTEYTAQKKSSDPTKIYYCYNIGNVTTGADKYTVFHAYNDDYSDLNDEDVDTTEDYTKHHAYLENKGVDEVNIDKRDDGGTVQTIDHYQMSIRHEDRLENENSTREGGSFGIQVGGIIGATTNTDINYCYNIGTIICRGLVPYAHRSNGIAGWTTYTEYHGRAGGIVGYVDKGTAKVSNSYSVGDIKLEARHAFTGSFGLENLPGLSVLKQFRQTRPMYVAGIVGHDNAQESPNVNNCFSLKWQCQFIDENNKLFRYHIEGYNDIVEQESTTVFKNRKPTIGNLLPSEDEHSSSGYVVSSVAQLTAITNASGIVTMPTGEDYKQAHSKKINTSETTTHNVRSAVYLNSVYNKNYNTYVYDGGVEGTVETLMGTYEDIKSGKYGGWIFMPGCLPQLAMFALDTQDGLAMTSLGYGRNNQGEFVKQIAGSEFNPYVIKDGIDLLGLSALVTGGADDNYVDFDNKYIEFANGVNNLSGDVTTSIQMPQYIANFNRSGNVRDYTFNDNGTVKEGKSFQLYNRAANGHHGLKKDSQVNASQAYTFTYTDENKQNQTANLGDKAPATSIYAKSQKTNGYFEYNKYTNTDITVTTYSLWYANHYVYTGSGYALCLDRDKEQTEPSMGNNVHNFNPIGYRGTVVNGASKQAFKGNISGAYYVEITNATDRQSALDNGTGYVYIKDKYVLYNKNNRDHKKYIEDGGKVYDVRQTEILDLEVRGGYITAVGSGNSAIKDSYAGLFGLVEDANISYITVTGTATAYGEENSTAQAGIVAKAYGDTKLTSLQAGVTSGAIENRLVVRTASGSYGYVGGIVGYADSGATGNRLIISDCVITNAEISTHKIPFATALDIFKIGAGGIVGYTQGDNITSYTDITDCHVVKAYIHSPNGFAVAGIVGNQGLKGALAVEDCAVGTKGAGAGTTNVTIEGMVAIGGIVSYAFALDTCSNSYIDCYVYEDVLIRRTDRNLDKETQEETNSISMIIEQYGVAIGGIVGAITDQAGKATFNGEIEFYGTIDLGNNTDNKNVGGAVGYMGTSAKINSGCVIRIGGTIKSGTENTIEDNNIGGFAGISKGVALDGAFYIYPTMTTSGCNNVGGFIGYNAGNTAVVRTAEIYTNYGPNTSGSYETKNSKINAGENVGGFIGENATGATITLGVATYEGTNYGTDNSEAVIKLGSSVDGTAKIGGLIGANYGTMYALECNITNIGHVGGDSTAITIDNAVIFNHSIGGVVGYVGPAGEVIVTDDATIVNSGQVGNENYQTAYQEYVGGIIGASYGSIEIGSLGTLANTGSVYGYRYVGGVIGVVGSGTISGTLSNGSKETSQAYSSSDNDSEAMSAVEDEGREGGTGATVTAVQNVGGVIGVVMEDATISGATLENYGTVTADSSKSDSYTLFVDAQGNPLVYKDGTLVDQNDLADPDDDVVYTIDLQNNKVVDANGNELTTTKTFQIDNVSNLGGVIGLHYGVINNSVFENYGTITAENFAGGAIGVSVGTISGTDDNSQTRFVNHATLTFTGDTALGGAVGYITDSYEEHSPGGNTTGKNSSTISYTYFSYEPANSTGDMTGKKVTVQATGATPSGATLKSDLYGGLGGVFGAIDSAEITEGTWTGNSFFIHGDVKGDIDKVDNVGGVVGIINGSYVTISNMLVYKSSVTGREYVGGIVGYNGSSNTNTGLDASIYNCYNVYGEVKANGINEAGGIVGHVPGDAKTFASYWIRDLENLYLQQSNPSNIAESINKAGTWTTFVTATEYANNIDIHPDDVAHDIYAYDDVKIDGLIAAAISQGKLEEGATRQDYYDMLTAQAIEDSLIPEGSNSDDYRDYILSQNGYLGKGGDRYATWKEYFDAHSDTYVKNENDDWGTYGEQKVNYNTGTEQTGYYYIFAKDASDYTNGKAITVNHTGGSNNELTEPYASDEALNYWLIIAKSPNRKVFVDANGNEIGYTSTNVYGNGNNAYGNVVPGVIYSSAYTATTETKNGYYLYINSSDASATDIYQTTESGSTKVYAATETVRRGENDQLLVAGNVMIFYKEYQSVKELEYNGFYRHAPANEELSYQAKKVGVAEPENGVNYFNGHYYYSFLEVTEPVEGSTVNFGKNAGTYDIKADLWTYDSNGQILVLGQVDSTDNRITADQKTKYQWTIKPRNVDVKYSSQVDRAVDGITDSTILKQYTGEFSHYITVTVSGIALDETIDKIVDFNSGTDVSSLLGIVWPEYEGSRVLATSNPFDKTMMSSNPESTRSVIAYCCVAGSVGKVSDNAENTIDSDGGQTLAEATYYTITYYVFAKNAGTYNISVDSDSNHKTLNTTGKIQVSRREISLTFDVDNRTTDDKSNEPLGSFDGGYIFDGGLEWRGVRTITMSNIASVDVNKFKNSYNTVFKVDEKFVDKVDNVQRGPEFSTSGSNVVLSFFTNDVGTYEYALTLIANGEGNFANNYQLSNAVSVGTIKNDQTTWSAKWTINPYKVNTGNVYISGKKVYYNGKTHSMSFEGSDNITEDGVFGITKERGVETVEFSLDLDISGEGGTQAVNKGTYPVKNLTLTGDDVVGEVTRPSSSKATSSNPLANYEKEVGTISLTGERDLTILPREIRLVWNGTPESVFAYNGMVQGLSAEDVKLEVMNDSGSFVPATDVFDIDDKFAIKIDGNKLTIEGVFAHHKPLKGEVSETLEFEIIDFIKTNAGEYQAVVSNVISKYQGENDAGNIVLEWRDNYKVAGELTHDYVIKKKEISLVWNDVEAAFTYNGKYQGFDNSALTFKVGNVEKTETINANETEFTVESGIGTEVLHFTIENFRAVNAGNYTAKITAFSSVTGSNTLTSNYELSIDLPTSKDYSISKLSISLEWNPDETEFVYNGKSQGMDANDLVYKLNGSTKSISISGNTLTAPGVNDEKITFTIANFTNVNAKKYTAVVNKPVASGTNEAGPTSLDNYTMLANWSASQIYEIFKKAITISWADNLETEYLYNGQYQGFDATSLKFVITNGDNAGEIASSSATISGGTLSLAGVVQGQNLGFEITDFKAVNAGPYTARVTYSGDTDNYAITLPGDNTYEIKARQIKLSWANLSENNFVYKGSAQGLDANNVVFEMQDESGNWVPVAGITINGNTLTAKAVGNETIDFAIDNFKNTNAGKYTATIANEIIGVAGNNATGSTTLVTNYNLESVPDPHQYIIDKSNITISVDGGVSNPDKVFDGNSKVYASLPGHTVSSTNGGSADTSVIQYTDARYWKGESQQHNVGDNYDIRILYALLDTDNYEVTNSSGEFTNADGEKITRYWVQVDAKASITPKGLTVIINTNNQTTATKVFDNNAIYAETKYNGTATAKSSGTQFRTGRGITVTGFVVATNNVVPDITVTATFEEIDDRDSVDRKNRKYFDAYVNGVYLDGTTYKQDSSLYFKQLRIVLSGDTTASGNYFIEKVATRSGQEILTQSAKPANGNYIIVPDSRAKDSATEGTNFRVTITPYSVKATYSHTVQSYANPDNTYNTNWDAVTGEPDKIPSGTDLEIKVTNGWMGPEGNRTVYKKYTRIVGSSNSNRLGATLESDMGYEFCVKLKNQPTLIIGYFVEKPDGYEIGTMAGLLIATEYYKGNFAPDGGKGYEYEETALNVKVDLGYDSWDELFADDNFDITKTPIYKAIEKAIADASSDADLKAALTVQLNSFEYSAEKDQWVYWKAKEILDDRKYDQFYLINNIDGILTASDMDILKGAFGTDFGIKWGVGTSSLGHVIFAEEGSVVIFNDSVFNTEFAGQFDGRGYTIDHLTISKSITSAGEYNVGMFTTIRTDGTREDGLKAYVSDINFRNLSLYVVDTSRDANTIINVGAVVGKYAGTIVMKNISVHGTISVKSTNGAVRVGGVIGYDTTGYVDSGISSVLERAIIVATLRGEGATAIVGGAIGVMSNPATSIAGIVSLSEVYAEGASTYANGYVGMYCVSGTALVDGINYAPATSVVEVNGETTTNVTLTSAFMDAVFEINANGDYTKVNGGGKTYDELYKGSTTAFNADGYYYGDTVTGGHGSYDVIVGYNIMTGADNDSVAKVRGSMRLVDIVDIYVLGYGTVKANYSDASTIQKLNTSKYFHASDTSANDSNYMPNGTTNGRIKIAYQQHLSLLRMFNYMNFEVTRDIKMYTGYKLAVVNEAFIGSVTSNSHIVNVRSAEQSSSGKATMFIQPLAFDWLVIDVQ